MAYRHHATTQPAEEAAARQGVLHRACSPHNSVQPFAQDRLALLQWLRSDTPCSGDVFRRDVRGVLLSHERQSPCALRRACLRPSDAGRATMRAAETPPCTGPLPWSIPHVSDTTDMRGATGDHHMAAGTSGRSEAWMRPAH
jgi:hypothetical protein